MSATTKATTVTAADLSVEIRNRYQPPEWHLEAEVTLQGRRLDMVAFNLWGARSYRVVGFEIKVSRGDWLREIADFQKSQEWLNVVDQFFVVAPGGLVRVDELPAGWGLLELRGSRMYVKAPATARPGTTLPREIAARFFTRLHRTVDELRRQISGQQRAVTIEESNRIRAEVQAEWLAKGDERLKRLQERVDEYECLLKDLGVDRDYNPPELIRRAVRLVRQTSIDRKLERLARDTERGGKEQAELSRQIHEFLSELQQVTG